jgi:hypothetical protein
VKTGRTTPDTKPDFKISDYERTMCLLLDTGFSGDKNVIKKEAKNVLNIKALQQKYNE